MMRFYMVDRLWRRGMGRRRKACFNCEKVHWKRYL